MAKHPHHNRRLSRTLLLASVALPLLSTFGAALGGPALPSGGSVAAGSVSIQQGASNTLILQQGKKAVINWQDFSIGQGGSVTVRQPDSSSILLNRVTGPGASAINGSLTANGQVWLLNGNGILFGQSAHIDVGGLIATTSDIRDADFLGGNYAFANASANPNAAVVNQGSIKAATGGSVVLSAGRVVNEGVVAAKLGHVVLGGANGFSVDFDGDNLLRYAVTAPVSQTPTTPDGKPAPALVANSGMISAEGGQVLMTARAARNVVNNVINAGGMVDAGSVSVQNGEIILDAGDGSVTVSGSLGAKGTGAGETGGKITVVAGNVTVADGARLDAAGDAGGGTIQIGGSLHGAGPLPNAQAVTMGQAAVSADAVTKGNGGTIAITSTGLTQAAGTLSAKGGVQGGDGGTIETSGHTLALDPGMHVDTSAAAGATGLWLLDPEDVNIDSTQAATIVGELNNSTNVSVTANDLTVNAPILYTSANSLTLLATHNLTVNSSVQNAGTGAIFAAAGWDRVTLDPASILTTPGAYGANAANGGNILIGGGGANTGVAIGSRGGTTTAVGFGLSLAAGNGYAQIGYHGDTEGADDATGAISVDMLGGIFLTGGFTAGGEVAQIGHGGYQVQHGNDAPISVKAGGNITMVAGIEADNYVMIGNGGLEGGGVQQGDIVATSGGDLFMSQTGNVQNKMLIGNNGASNLGKVTLVSSGDVILNAGAQINAAASGDALVIAAAGNFVNQAQSQALNVTDGRWLIFYAAPQNNTTGGLSATPYYDRAFDFTNDSYEPIAGTGNRFVYALAPVVTVTLDDKTKTYRDPNPTLTATITGGLPGDSPSGVYTGAPVLSTMATTGSGVGDYAIAGTLGTLSSEYNYHFAFVDGTLHIDPVILTAGLTGTTTKVYDGSRDAALATDNYTLSGVLSGENVSLNSPAIGSYDTKDVASHKNVSVSGLSLLGPDQANYVLASTGVSAAIGQITPATLTYVADTANRTYGGANPAFDGTVTGFVNGEGLEATSGALSFTSGANATSGVGSYAINGSGLSAANYNFVQAGTNATALTINPATLTYVASAANRTYGGADPAFGGTVTGFVNGEGLEVTSGALSFTSGASATSGVGSYAINGSGLSAANYNFVQAASNTTALTINSATLTYVASAATRTYGGANPAFGGTVTGFVNGEGLEATSGALSFTSGASATSPVGSYAISGSGLSAANYTFVQAGTNATALTINPATLTYVANAASRGYGAANPEFGGTVTGFVNGEGLEVASGALSFTSGASATSGVGSYAINGSGLSAANYTFVQAVTNATALTINPATLTYVASAANRTYGGANPVFGGTVTGFVNGEGLEVTGGALSFTSGASATSGVGSYAIGGSGLSAANYNFVQAGTNATALTINPATLTYVASAANRTYGGANPAFDGTVTGFINGEGLEVTSGALSFTSGASTTSGVGSYAINGSGLSAANYTFVQAASNTTALTINPATLTYVASAANRTYGGANPAFGGTVTGFVNGEGLTATGGSLIFTSAANAASNVGSYAIAGSGLTAANYVFAQAAGNATALTVNPATLTASLTGTVQKVYDGTVAAILSAGNYLLAGAPATASVSLNIPANGLYDNANAGTGKTVSVGGLALLGADRGNFVLASTAISGQVGVITAAETSPTVPINVLGNSYISTTVSLPQVTAGLVLPPVSPPPVQNFSDATSDITSASDDESGSADLAAERMGQSLSGVTGAVQSSTSTVIEGLLRQFSPPPGGAKPHGALSSSEVYSSWGNEAFWQ